MRLSRIWEDVLKRKRAGFGHDEEVSKSPPPGGLAFFCPCCAQPTINLPDRWWEEENAILKYCRCYCLDGNFKADHIEMSNKNDVYLSDGLGFFVGRKQYQKHLDSTPARVEVSAPYIYK